MYKTSDLKTLLLFDIETLPEKWDSLSEEKEKLWKNKYHFKCFEQEVDFIKKQKAIELNEPNLSLITIDTNTPNFSFKSIYTKYAGLYPEFSKVWCISFGMFDVKNNLIVNTLQEDDEKEMLLQWLKVLEHYESFNLAGYNIGGFDIPFLLTRMQILGLNETYPKQLQLKDAKPWTTTYVDFQLDWKNLRWEAVSLDAVCLSLGVKSPKAKFQNHEFTTLLTAGKITTEEGIAYCEGDVVALGECMVKCSSDECNFSPEKAKTWSKTKNWSKAK